MTDISAEPVVGTPAPPVPTNSPPPNSPAPAAKPPVKEAPAVAHTPGGWPVVPLATTGVNSTVGGIAAASIAAGPPGAALAAAGAVVMGAAVLARRAARNRTAKSTARAGASKVPASRSSRQTSATGTRSTAGIGGAGGGRKTAGSGGMKGAAGGSRAAQSRTAQGGTGQGRTAQRQAATSSISSAAQAGKAPKSRAGQVRALRQEARSVAAGLPRAERRAQAVRDRRAVADSRRTAASSVPRANQSKRTDSPKSFSGGGRSSSGSGLAGRVRAGRDTAVQRARVARDRSAARAVDGAREQVRSAQAAKQAKAAKKAVRRQARKALWKSAARKQGRRLLAALLAAPVGVLGMLTTPLGRKLGIKALQYPGRRLYRRLMRTAEEQQAVRDAAIREERAAAEAAIDAGLADEQQIGDRVERPAFLTPALPSIPLEVVNMSGFKFEEAAAEMENAARTYEPDTAMEILSMVDNLPDALTSVANTFRILAERSDSEFPLEKDIAGAFDEIYGALMRAVDASGDLGPLFRQVHEHDIARHEDPRNGVEAEKGWNV